MSAWLVALLLAGVPVHGRSSWEVVASPVTMQSRTGVDTLGTQPLPLAWITSYRSGWTDDRDNGALWAGKGISGLIRGGVAWQRGPLRIVVAPEATFATNGAFPLANVPFEGYSPFSAPWLPVDQPRRWGSNSALRLAAGQSRLEARWTSVAIGATTANDRRGPELRYPLILGASAPGVPTLFVEGMINPGGTGIWTVRASWGRLHESPHFDADPENDKTLLSLFFLDWAPRFADGLQLGASVTYRDPLEDGFTPSMLWQAFSTTSAQAEAQRGEDALGAVHFRWAGGPSAIWGTWGRGDYWRDTDDLLTEPDHSQLYVVGLSWKWTSDAATWVASTEAANLAGTLSRGLRPFLTTRPYRHASAVQGYTHQGQMLGASIGPGSQGAWIRVERTDSTRTLGVELERIIRDLDAYHEALQRPDGTAGEDREWRLGLLYEGPVPRLDWPGVSVKANGGLSLRWNRDYIQYSTNAHLVGPRESQIFLDLALTWDPWRKKDPPPPAQTPP